MRWANSYFAESQVAEESNGNVQAGDNDHAGVEDTCPASESAWLPHLILQRKNHTNTLKGINGCPEV